jgi:hypothetical protein
LTFGTILSKAASVAEANSHSPAWRPGLHIERVEPNTTVGRLLVGVLGPALADRPPMPSLDLRPLDLDTGIGLQDLAVVGVSEGPARTLLLETKHALSPSVSRR